MLHFYWWKISEKMHKKKPMKKIPWKIYWCIVKVRVTQINGFMWKFDGTLCAVWQIDENEFNINLFTFLFDAVFFVVAIFGGKSGKKCVKTIFFCLWKLRLNKISALTKYSNRYKKMRKSENCICRKCFLRFTLLKFNCGIFFCFR